MQMQCEECRYWDQDRKNPSLGVCRRYAPKALIGEPVKGDKVMDAIWPRTGSDQWCGEWVKRIEIEEGK